jgi:hypothetical protein
MVLSPEVNLLGHEADHSPVSSAGCRLNGSIPLLVLCTFMVCIVTFTSYCAGEIVCVGVQSLDFA